MLLQFLIFLVGLGILYVGAEWLIKGAASLAIRYGIRPLVVGITVVALGTSMPEFVVNFFAALSGDDGIALGNIVGSNIANIALILGFNSIVLPIVISPGTLRKEYPIMMLVMVLFYIIALDGVISKLDGLILVTGLIGFFVFLVYDSRRQAGTRKREGYVQKRERQEPVFKRVMLVLGGVLLLTVGARLMVYAAVNIANEFGIHQVVVGLTIVAIGTSLPELAASLVGAIKNEMDLSFGNILGSNLLNVLFVVGLVAMISPLQVDTESLAIHFPVMLGFGIVLLPIAWTSYKISRVEGAALLACFSSYVVYLILPYL